MEGYAMQKIASDSEAVWRLNEQGASVDRLDDEGRSPLADDVLVEYGRRCVKELLIYNQCNLNLNTMGMASIVYDPEYEIILESEALANGADVLLFYASILGWEEIVQQILKRGGGAHVNISDNVGRTPLMFAALFGHEEVVGLLIRGGAQVNVSDHDGITPLMFAARFGHEEVVGLLIRFGAQINVSDHDGITPLKLASGFVTAAVAWLLIRGGAQLNVSDHDGRTPLMIAARFGHEEVVDLLIRFGAQMNVSDHDGTTPLMFAAQDGYEEIVGLLIRCGAQVNVRDKLDVTALHKASFYGHADVVGLLLKEDGIDLDPEDCEGETPLHLACFVEDLETVQHLLKAGANIKAKNKKGESALSISISEENLEVVRLLVEQGAHFEDEEYFRMFQNTSLSFKEGVLKDVELCTRSLLNKFHNQSLPALERITKFSERLPRIEKLKLKNSQIHEIENYVRNDILENNFRNLERTCSSVLSVLCVECLMNNQ